MLASLRDWTPGELRYQQEQTLTTANTCSTVLAGNDTRMSDILILKSTRQYEIL